MCMTGSTKVIRSQHPCFCNTFDWFRFWNKNGGRANSFPAKKSSAVLRILEGRQVDSAILCSFWMFINMTRVCWPWLMAIIYFNLAAAHSPTSSVHRWNTVYCWINLAAVILKTYQKKLSWDPNVLVPMSKSNMRFWCRQIMFSNGKLLVCCSWCRWEGRVTF